MRIRVEIVTGFLGSGKTTFINSYLETFSEKDKPYVITLEKGNTRLKEKHKAYYAKSLNELEIILEGLNKNIERPILIEHNGTIEIKEISEILLKEKFKKKFKYHGIYFVGNYENLKFIIKNIGEILIPFIQSSKLVILNNYKNISIEERKGLLETIKEINLNAPILEISSLENMEEEIRKNRFFKPFKINQVIKRFVKGGKEW